LSPGPLRRDLPRPRLHRDWLVPHCACAGPHPMQASPESTQSTPSVQEHPPLVPWAYAPGVPRSTHSRYRSAHRPRSPALRVTKQMSAAHVATRGAAPRCDSLFSCCALGPALHEARQRRPVVLFFWCAQSLANAAVLGGSPRRIPCASTGRAAGIYAVREGGPSTEPDVRAVAAEYTAVSRCAAGVHGGRLQQ
jgi:hypothetical protein